MNTGDGRQVRARFGMLFADPYRKLAAVALAFGLWFFVNAQVERTSAPLTMVLAAVPAQHAKPASHQVSVELPTDQGCRVEARERRREGDSFVYDLEIATDGGARERWQGLRLRAPDTGRDWTFDGSAPAEADWNRRAAEPGGRRGLPVVGAPRGGCA